MTAFISRSGSTSRSTRRSSDPVKDILFLGDKNKFNIPEGDYIDICVNLRRIHLRSATNGFVKKLSKVVPRIVTMATVPLLILRSLLKFKKQNSTENVMPNGSTFTIVRGDDKFILG